MGLTRAAVALLAIFTTAWTFHLSGWRKTAQIKSFSLYAGKGDVKLQTPESIEIMMEEAAEAISALVESEDGGNLALVDVPLPVTGGTELDDWPGGVLQQYSVIAPMLGVTMKALNFSSEAINARDYLNPEDAVGVWGDQGVTLACFCTPEQIPKLKEKLSWSGSSDVVVMVNNKFFLDPLSKDESKEFLDNAAIAYKLEQLNMRGPNALPCRGVLFRKYPGPFKAARRLDGGGYVVLAEYSEAPDRASLEDLFMEDSIERDKNLTMQQRMMRMIPQLPT